MALQTGKISDMSIEQALGLAIVREQQAEAAEVARIEGELSELSAEGVYVPISARELLRLERAGMVLDFATGRVIDQL